MNRMADTDIIIPDASWWDRIIATDARNFGIPADSFADPANRQLLALDRFRVAWSAGDVAGQATSVPLDLTLPGGVTVPAMGVTWVSVNAGHRRRGVLRRLLDEVHADGRLRGEPVQILHASEAGIYGRFGYGEVTEWWGVELDAASARLHANGLPADDLLPITEASSLEADGHVEAMFDAVRRQRPGEVSRAEAMWQVMRNRWRVALGDALPAQVITCDGGYATYRIAPRWDVPERGGRPSHVMTVVDVMALTPQAHRSLWHRMIHTDLVATIRCSVLSPDDPLPLLLADRRWLRTTSMHDGLWMRVDDPVGAFAARRYGSHDRLTLAVDGRLVTIEGSTEGSDCGEGGASPDLVVDPRALGPLLMGPRSFHRLVASGLIVPSSQEMAHRAARFFAADRSAHCSTHF